MPTPTPQGIFSVLPFAFAQLLSESAANQAQMGVASAAAALARIPVITQVDAPETPDLNEPALADVPRPRIIVGEPQLMEFGRSGFITNADVLCIFEMDTPTEYRKNNNSIEGPAPQDIVVLLRNWAGLTTKEIMLLGENGGGHPLILGGRARRVDRSMPDESSDFCRLIVTYNCGTRAGGRNM